MVALLLFAMLLLGSTQDTCGAIKLLKEACLAPEQPDRCMSLYFTDDVISWENAFYQCLTMGKRLVVIDSDKVQGVVNSEFVDLNSADFRMTAPERKKAWIALKRLNDTVWRWIDGRRLEGKQVELSGGNYADCSYAALDSSPQSTSNLALVAEPCRQRRPRMCAYANHDCVTQGQDIGHLSSRGVCLVYSPQKDRWSEQRRHCVREGGDLVTLNDKITEEDIINLLQNTSDQRAWLGLSQIPWQWQLPDGEIQSCVYHNFYDDYFAFMRHSNLTAYINVRLQMAAAGKWEGYMARAIYLPFFICETVPGKLYTPPVTQPSTLKTSVTTTPATTPTTGSTTTTTTTTTTTATTRSASSSVGFSAGNLKTSVTTTTGTTFNPTSTPTKRNSATTTTRSASSSDKPIPGQDGEGLGPVGKHLGFSTEMKIIFVSLCLHALLVIAVIVLSIYLWKIARKLKKQTGTHQDQYGLQSVGMDHTDSSPGAKNPSQVAEIPLSLLSQDEAPAPAAARAYMGLRGRDSEHEYRGMDNNSYSEIPAN